MANEKQTNPTGPNEVPNNDGMTRREAMLNLLRLGGVAAGTLGAGAWLSSQSEKPEPARPEQARRDHRVAADPALAQIAVAQYALPKGAKAVAGEPRALAAQAIADLGGITRFIRPGDHVVLKPNIAWDRTPEQAANTNPVIVAEVVRQCLSAGAR